jgi:hypothetical protein
MKPLITIAGYIKPITIREFAKLIPRAVTGMTAQPFNTMVKSDYTWVAEEDAPTVSVSNYKRLVAYPNQLDPIKAILTGLGLQASYKIVYKNTPLYILEDAAVEQAENFGEPTHAVRIAPRQWLMVNPEDYTLYWNENGYALACFRQDLTIVNEVLRITLKQAEDYVKKTR